jgi:hypothetical protein
MTRKEFIEDVIVENCLECEHFFADIRTSPCLCDVIADVILQESSQHGRNADQKYVSEWEHQQEERLKSITRS